MDKAWKAHPLGGGKEAPTGYPAPHRVETLGGTAEVEWEEQEAVSLHGPLAYFIEFLKVSGLWQNFVEACPLTYSSLNAPSKEEILGTILFSVLSGQRRYAHIFCHGSTFSFVGASGKPGAVHFIAWVFQV